MISFSLVPSDIRVPGSYVEFDSSKARSGIGFAPQKILVIGQRLASGTMPALTPTRIVKADDAKVAFGRGSFGALTFAALKGVNDATESWAIALDDVAGGSAASGSLTFAGTATQGGTLYLYIAGSRVAVGVPATSSAAAIAIAVASAVNMQVDLPVTATSAGAVVTITCRHKGSAGNDIDLRLNYYEGESLPPGIGVAIAPMAGGATNADIGAVWAAIGDVGYSLVILPFADLATLTSAENEMQRRSGPLVALDGIAVAGVSASFSAAAALGASRNAQFCSLVPAKKSPSHPVAWAASYYGVITYHAAIDPARPFQELKVSGLLPPVAADRFIQSERELLLRTGMSTWTVDSGGSVLIERPIMTYKMNPQGFDDPSWLDINLPLMLANIRLTYRRGYANKYPRHKLADDGTNYGAGQAIVTPSVLSSENVAIYRDLEEAGQVEDLAGFKAEMIVERDQADRGRVNMLLPVRLVGQFRVQAMKIEYRL